MSTHRQPATKPTAEETYVAARRKALELAEWIQRLLENQPAPEIANPPIHWGHVGTLTEVNRRLAGVVDFLLESE